MDALALSGLDFKITDCKVMGMTDLHQYLTDQSLKQAELAQQIGISASMLNLILSGKRKPGIALTKRIEAVTGIPRIDLRPDIFGDAQ